MDWDFMTAMGIVALTALWLAYRTIRNAKKMRDAVSGKSDISALCKDCPMHEKCTITHTHTNVKIRIMVEPGNQIEPRVGENDEK